MKKEVFRNDNKIWTVARNMILIGIISLCNLKGFSQATTGKISGRVTDEKTNQPLMGVSISAKGTKYGVASQSDGSYVLVLPAGTYTISVSMSGYGRQDISGVEIKKEETVALPIVLSVSANVIDTFVKTAPIRRATQAALYNLQKRQSAASDVISIEAILKTPDSHVGQIGKRITGVSVNDNRFIVVRGLADQYNNTILNGVPMTSTETDRNAFSLDLIPAVVVDNIIVNKTATPDMPGNFAGGLVQINTKDFPADNFISLSVQGSFFDQTAGKKFYSDKRGGAERFGLKGNQRDLPAGFPSTLSKVSLINLNVQERVRYLKMLPNNLTPVDYGESKPNYNIQIGYGKSFRFKNNSQLGIVAAVTQRKTELIEQETTARLPIGPGAGGVGDFVGLNYYSENVRYNYESQLGGALNIAYRIGTNKINFSNLFTNIFRNLYLDRSFALAESFASVGSLLGGTSYISDERRIINNILSGEHRTGKNNETTISWNVNTSIYRTDNPDTRNFVYVRLDSLGNLLGNNNAGIAQALSTQSRIWSKNKDFIYGGAFNVTSSFKLFGQKQVFKGGMLYQTRRRKANGLLIPYYAPQGKLDSLLASSNIYPGGPLDYTISFAAIAEQVGNYNAGSSLIAAYESLENNIGEKLRIIWGLRVENYHQYVNVYKPFFFNNFQEPDLLLSLYTSRTSFNFLPSVNFVYNITGKLNARAAYSATAIRPELKDLAPFKSYDFKTLQVTEGNSELRSTFVKNYDVKLEYFPVGGEIISISAYYKDITDPIEKVPGTDNDPQIRPLNTGKASVKGIEAEIRKKLNFIPGMKWLENVLVFGNASLIGSKVKAGPLNNFSIRQVTEHPLSGQPGFIINAGISIAVFKKSFEVTFSFNKTDDYIIQLGTFNEATLANGNKTPTIPHLYLRGREIGDLVFTQSVFRNKGKIKFNVSNLFNARFTVYQDLNGNGKFDEPVTVDKSVIDYLIKGGIDNTPSNIVPQRNYSLSFSYTFNQK